MARIKCGWRDFVIEWGRHKAFRIGMDASVSDSHLSSPDRRMLVFEDVTSDQLKEIHQEIGKMLYGDNAVPIPQRWVGEERTVDFAGAVTWDLVGRWHNGYRIDLVADDGWDDGSSWRWVCWYLNKDGIVEVLYQG